MRTAIINPFTHSIIEACVKFYVSNKYEVSLSTVGLPSIRVYEFEENTKEYSKDITKEIIGRESDVYGNLENLSKINQILNLRDSLY